MIGLIVVGHESASQDTFFQPGDPLYEPPPDPTTGYVVGGSMMAAGAGLLIYSFAALPKQPQSKREWVETGLVESTGCVMPGVPNNIAATPPAPAPVAAPANDVTARL